MDNPLVQQFPAPTRVAQVLQDRIVRGVYVNGSWLPAERDLSQEFSVSRPVIRAALNQLQDEGWIIRETGCRPRVHMQVSLESEQAFTQRQPSLGLPTIAVVLPYQPVFVSAHAILCGITSVLQQENAPYRPTVLDSHPPMFPENIPGKSEELERSYLEKIETDGNVGAIIWHLTGEETHPTLQRLQHKGISLVFVDRQPVGMNCHYVGVDNRAGITQAVDYLLELGHRKIAFLTTYDRASTVRERESGYRDALIKQGIRPAPELTFSVTIKNESLSSAVDYFFKMPNPPTAMLCCNDLHAFGFIREARAQGYRIPEDMSVIGFDDIEYLSPHMPTLTTVHQPFYEIGQQAAELLLRDLKRSGKESSAPYQHIILPTTLVVRTTSSRH